MALTKVINDLADLNQSGSTNALKGCAGTTAQQPASSSSIEYLIVGGGGSAYGDGGGAGGAGGLLTGTTTVYHGTPTIITVGEGAISPGVNYADTGIPNGENSVFNGIIAYGGGTGVWRWAGGGSYLLLSSFGKASNSGGSGSGGGHNQGGSGSTPANVTLAGSGISGQGFSGGEAGTDLYSTGGGGGAGAVGSTGSSGQSGNGGNGIDMQAFISSTDATTAGVGEVIASEVWFAGGGGGGGAQNGGVLPGTGGKGGGANGSQIQNTAYNGDTNTGGGAGAGNMWGPGSTYSGSSGGAGGSGVVILKYDNTVVTGYSTANFPGQTCDFPSGAGAIAFYQLNSDGGTTNNVPDTCGSYNGTGTAITYSTGKFGNAAVFDGTSSYIDIGGTIANSQSNLTVSMWLLGS